MNNILFKSHNLQLEFMNIDGRLQTIIYALAGFTVFKFGKAITLTELLRSQEMQDRYYSDSQQYLANPWKSVHQYGRGADVSLSFYTDEEVKEIEQFLNNTFKYVGTVKTALIHNVGFGNHLHIQVDNEDITKIVKI